jgi:disulfide bond formation protein DsbB
VTRWLEGGRPHAAIAAVALAAVGAALTTQHGMGMLPCPWCILQRMVFVAIALVALPAARIGALRRPLAAVVAALAACGAAAALWQRFVAASSTSCKLTLADRIIGATGLDALWPDVFAPWANCADAAVNLLGLPYEAWSLALFVAIGAVAVALALRRGAR